MADRLKAYGSGAVVLHRPSPEAGGWLAVEQMQTPVIDERDRVGRHAANALFGTASQPFAEQYTGTDRILTDDQLWRVYLRTPDVRAAVDAIVRRVATWDWLVEPTLDPADPGYAAAMDEAQKAATFLHAPNTDGESWQELMIKVCTDLLVFDAGVIECVYGGTLQPDGVVQSTEDLQELVALRGSTITPVVDQFGHVLGYTQNTAEFATPIVVQTGDATTDDVLPHFGTEQIVYMRLFPNTATPMGQPLIETLINEVITMLRSAEHSMLAFDADEIPPGILVLTGIAGKAAQAAKADLQTLRGKDHKVRVITNPDPKATGANWVELRRTPKDVDFVNVVAQVRRTIWRVFGVLPVEMGASEDIPRAVGQVQLEVSTSHLINPILELIEAKVNARLLPLVVGDPTALERLRFRFDRDSKLSAEDQRTTAQTLVSLVREGLMTRNEARAVRGAAPVQGGDVITLTTGQGVFPLTTIVGTNPSSPGTQPEDPPDGDGTPPAPGDALPEVERLISDLPDPTQKALRAKAEEHNAEHGDDDRKRTTADTLAKVYVRGIGAYETNPESVRPGVNSPEQWAMARVNSFLYALRNLRFRSGKHDTDLLPEAHPMSSKGDRAVGDVDPTNFPKAGDDLPVSLDNSKFDVFDADYAEDLRENYPEIWRMGGNIKGNDQYRDLRPVVRRGGSVENRTEEAAVRLREAWSARHFEDFRVPGVVAQIKWFTVGTLGEAGMIDLIDSEKAKIDAARSVDRSLSDLPSDWQPGGMFDDVRTVDLTSLADTVADYARIVAPLYAKAEAEAVAAVGALYRPGELVDTRSERLQEAISRSLDKLQRDWAIATEPMYLRASRIGRDAAADWTGQPVLDDWRQRGILFGEQAMAYLTEPGGLIADLRLRALATVNALSVRARNPGAEPSDLDPEVPVEVASASMAGAFQAERFRVGNWSGKLVELTNQTAAAGVVAASTAVIDGQIQRTDWLVEWVTVGDRNTCPTCETEGRSTPRFRPIDQLATVPGGATECRAKCRCVLVWWTRQEVESGQAVPLGPRRN